MIRPTTFIRLRGHPESKLHYIAATYICAEFWRDVWTHSPGGFQGTPRVYETFNITDRVYDLNICELCEETFA